MADVPSNEGGAARSGAGAAAVSPRLAHRPDFRLGAATVRPSIRTVEGPAGCAAAEPRVMQVLLAFADADGAVLTREDLIRIAWGGTIVGDDSVNRAIGEVRRIARDTGAGFTVETISRVGYRLDAEVNEASPQAALPITSRRWAIGGAVAAALVGIGGWSLLRDRTDPRAVALIERGKQALRYSLPDSDAQGVSAFSAAVAIEPRNSEAWGLLALAHRKSVENDPPDKTVGAVQAAERAARRALALDPKDGNALAALATLRPTFGDWYNAENRLLDVLKVAPNNDAAMAELVMLLQQVGRRRDSWKWNERALALEPLSPVHTYRRALKQWIFGRVSEADLTIDRGLQLFPRHPAIWNARLLIFAFTGRPQAALVHLRDEQVRPATSRKQTIAFWTAGLAALESRSAAERAAARDVMLDYARRSPFYSVNATMILAALGEVDAAFTVAEGYLLRRGPLVGTLFRDAGQMPVNDHAWRRTMFIFTPATAAMRADPRFKTLCDGIGLTDYWKRRGIWPD